MKSFFTVKKPEEVLKLIDQFTPCGVEIIPVENALGRILSQDIIAKENLPDFFRSSMDGYAVKAENTFGASESLPCILELAGEVLMGQAPGMTLAEGQAVKISTGGMLPEGANGVVMVEYCHLLDDKTIEVSRTIAPLENVIQPGDDLKIGSTVLKKGCKLRPQDLGVIAGLAYSNISVFTKPKVAIISTGDEIIPINETPGVGQVRDINRYTLGAFCQMFGADPIYAGICRDDFNALKKMIDNVMEKADSIWISGGSSVGTRDLTLKVFESLHDFELLVHGISISPGKPTIIGRSESKPIIGLPGHVASAMVVAQVYLRHLLLRLSGYTDSSSASRYRINAIISQNIESASGREDYIRVKLTEKGNVLIAEPVFGKSGLISTLVDSDGLVRVDMNTEGLYEGQMIEVLLFSA
ncbi:MAG TPA: molybdopterin molybdotransferase MoeA [Desulfobacteraceae bacterium]|nr:molybdopterin molybdotransferase MoeA [Desulfobacteraceae bacterium]HPJ68411.1 molybdopterin molybdotransferase MoeA [Desulfobacteraceae bacterium]HPQ27243.1 molybdopterin molybdotransferase MoeA [Desulfobacteraceae bacterium]